MSENVKKAVLNPYFLNPNAKLPYNLTVKEVKKSIENTYELLYDLNNSLISKGYSRLEKLLLGNSLSGLISEVVVKQLSDNSDHVTRNMKVGGHPDLIPVGMYPDNMVLHGEEGIEIKSSIQSGGWQGHNPENAHIIIFRYKMGDITRPDEEMDPISFIQVLCAQLKKDDWNFSGRSENSRRTITASITANGMDKLRRNPIYQDPKFIVAPNIELKEIYTNIFKI